VGAIAYYGQRPTFFLTDDTGAPIPGTGTGNAPFYRAGVYGAWYFGAFDITTAYFHGRDSVFLATATPKSLGIAALPPGSQAPTWNNGLFEAHYTVNPQLILIAKYDMIRMGTPTFNAATGFNPNTGNVDAWTIAYRYYPMMFSRAGLAWHVEYSHLQQKGVSQVFGTSATNTSIFTGLDFDF